MRQRNPFLPFQTNVQESKVNNSAQADRKLVSSVEWVLQRRKRDHLGIKRKSWNSSPSLKKPLPLPPPPLNWKGLSSRLPKCDYHLSLHGSQVSPCARFPPHHLCRNPLTLPKPKVQDHSSENREAIQQLSPPSTTGWLNHKPLWVCTSLKCSNQARRGISFHSGAPFHPSQANLQEIDKPAGTLKAENTDFGNKFLRCSV